MPADIVPGNRVNRRIKRRRYFIVQLILKSDFALLMAASVISLPVSIFAISLMRSSCDKSEMWLVVLSSSSTLYTR